MPVSFHLGVARDNATRERLAAILARHMAAADVTGRLQVLRHARAKTQRALPLSASSRSLRFAENDDDDQNPLTAGIAFDVGGEEAGSYLRGLTPVTKQVFDGLTAQYRNDAFTLAGAADRRLVEKIQEALAAIAAKGGTAADFRAAVDELTTNAGVDSINAFTLDTAFQIAMQKAYSAGRLAQMQEPHMLDALPFWQYWTAGDLRVRPAHAVLDGFVARAIDPVWSRIYPPWDFGCRCSVVPLPEEEALAIDKNAGEGGLERLPALAQVASVVAEGRFHSLMHP